MIKKAVIPAAGYGTRSLPITKVLPKEMLPIIGRPAIDFIVEEAVSSGIKEILIVLSRSKTMIMDYYDRSLELESFLEDKNKKDLLEKIKLPDVHIQYVRQPYAKGLGDAIYLAKPFVGNEPFAILLPDEIMISKQQTALSQLMMAYDKYHSNIIAVQQEKVTELKNYGVIDGSKIDSNIYELKGIIEKPQSNPPSNLAVIGRYLLNPSIFHYLDKLKPGINDELQLTDALREMLKDERGFGIEVSAKRFDIGKEVEYVNLIKRLSGLN